MERYFDSTDDNEDESAIARYAASLLSDLLVHEYRQYKTYFPTNPKPLEVSWRMLEHASSAVQMEAIRLLASVSYSDKTYRTAILNNETVRGTIVQLFDAVASSSGDEEADFVYRLVPYAFMSKEPDTLNLVLPFVPGMTNILRKQVSASDVCDEEVIRHVLSFLERLSRDDSPVQDQVLDSSSDIPHLAAAVILLPDSPEDETVEPAVAILDALLRRHSVQRFLDVGGLAAVHRRLGSRAYDMELTPLLVGILAELAAVVEPPHVRQQLLGCNDIVWQACDSVFKREPDLYDFDSTAPGSEDIMTLLERLGCSGDVDHLHQAIQNQHILHALAFSLALRDDQAQESAMDTLALILARVGMAFCQQYVRNLLAERSFFPLVRTCRLNRELDDTVFSAVVKSPQFRAQCDVVDLLVLLGVQETDVVIGHTDKKAELEALPFVVPGFYQRFHQAEVMVVLCATRTVARHCHPVVSLPEELWRMVHEMMCYYGPIVEEEEEEEDSEEDNGGDDEADDGGDEDEEEVEDE